MKYCSKCKIEKDSSEFHKLRISKDGLQPRCKECANPGGIPRIPWDPNATSKVCYSCNVDKPLTEFSKRANRKMPYASNCKACRRDYASTDATLARRLLAKTIKEFDRLKRKDAKRAEKEKRQSQRSGASMAAIAARHARREEIKASKMATRIRLREEKQKELDLVMDNLSAIEKEMEEYKARTAHTRPSVVAPRVIKPSVVKTPVIKPQRKERVAYDPNEPLPEQPPLGPDFTFTNDDAMKDLLG